MNGVMYSGCDLTCQLPSSMREEDGQEPYFGFQLSLFEAVDI